MSFFPAEDRPARAPQTHAAGQSLAARYASIRAETERLAEPLSAEDQCVQSMADASPTKWHRAHTTWFFETFVLLAHVPGYHPYDCDYGYLFNSYYEAVGERHARDRRGLLTRPSAEDIGAYRRHVDRSMCDLLAASNLDDGLRSMAELGLQHEQQHQELLLTDILHAFAQNPLLPAYGTFQPWETQTATAPEFVSFDGGIVEIGHSGNGFCFDNERPRHEAL